MADAGAVDHTWLVDMVVQFIQSPQWNEPVQTFIRENCTKYDNFQEENKHEYVEVHNEFKNLVDSLLTAHLLEVDLDPEEFEKKVMESGLADDPKIKQVLSQLQAAEDFMTFKNMMVERHEQLQHEAEANFQEVSASQAEAEALAFAEAEAIAAEADAAAAAHAGAAAAPAAAAPASPPKVAAGIVPGPAPTAEEERAFGAGGGSYGRAQMGAPKKAGTNDKAAAIRKAILAGTKK